MSKWQLFHQLNPPETWPSHLPAGSHKREARHIVPTECKDFFWKGACQKGISAHSTAEYIVKYIFRIGLVLRDFVELLFHLIFKIIGDMMIMMMVSPCFAPEKIVELLLTMSLDLLRLFRSVPRDIRLSNRLGHTLRRRSLDEVYQRADWFVKWSLTDFVCLSCLSDFGTCQFSNNEVLQPRQTKSDRLHLTKQSALYQQRPFVAPMSKHFKHFKPSRSNPEARPALHRWGGSPNMAPSWLHMLHMLFSEHMSNTEMVENL